jgi:xylulokinase
MSGTGKVFIGLDIGTQSTKGLLVDSTKEGALAVISRASVAYDLIPGLPAGAAEQHPHTWRDAVRQVLSQLLRDIPRESIGGIGVSGQQHGLVVLDERDEVVRPAKLWCDTTTIDEATEITRRSKYAVPTGFTLPKLLWMKRYEPENFARVKTVLLPHDYINFLLTGEKFMEAGDASGSGAFDPKTRRFDDELLAWLDPRARSMFPRLVEPNRPAGRVSRTGAEFFGLPEGIVVSPGGGDNMMSAIGSGATEKGVTVVSLGTSGTVFAYSETPVLDPEGLIAGFCDSTGAWMPLLCTMNVTGVTEEVREAFGLGHHEITAKAAEVPPLAGGVLFLPYLQGERVPNLPQATGAILGIRPGFFEPGRLYRAAIEGTTLGLVSGVMRMKKLGLLVESVRVVGGGSKNHLWRQILADALGAPVTVLEEPESAALGGAIQAIWVSECESRGPSPVGPVARRYVSLSDSATHPNAENHALYERALAHFDEQTVKLFGVSR